MKELIQEYKESLSTVRQAIRKTQSLPQEVKTNVSQLRILRSMERDLLFSISLMEKEKGDLHQRGMSRRSKNQREVHCDPKRLDEKVNPNVFMKQESPLSSKDQLRIYRAMEVLTPLEREIYILRFGQEFTYKEIATLMDMTPASVQQSLIRAEQKINRKVILMKTMDHYQQNLLKEHS